MPSEMKFDRQVHASAVLGSTGYPFRPGGGYGEIVLAWYELLIEVLLQYYRV